MAENEKLFWDHLQHHICLMLNNSNAFYTWAHTWLGIKRPQSLSLTMYTHSSNTCVDTAVLCCIFWDPHLTVLCAHSFSCMFLICKGYIQNFSLWYATICLFVFVKWVFTTSPGLIVKFLGPLWFIWLDLWHHCAGTSQHTWLQTAPLKAPEIH